MGKLDYLFIPIGEQNAAINSIIQRVDFAQLLTRNNTSSSRILCTQIKFLNALYNYFPPRLLPPLRPLERLLRVPVDLRPKPEDAFLA